MLSAADESVRTSSPHLPFASIALFNKHVTYSSGQRTLEPDNARMHKLIRILRLKVRPESYRWLNAAAIEANQIFNYCNEISYSTATRTDRKRKWLSGFDLCDLTAGASEYFEHIGADTIQRICNEYACKRRAAKRLKLRWRVSRGARRSLGWIPMKAASLRRKGHALRFCGKTFRVFERERLEGIQWQGGCFAQDAVGDLVALLTRKSHPRVYPRPETSGRDRPGDQGRRGHQRWGAPGGDPLLSRCPR